ncbi:Sulfhydryl oxidase [Echinococcus multilocularis]|uniref:Sulfhydryl oxidase n=1 Tax=Echinococcus multilocularis TaxID=6211 RepID=A0A0S4MM00_ECHMU|nr:Sulfhydryl oxidase [Echinococcus multilocularis]
MNSPSSFQISERNLYQDALSCRLRRRFDLKVCNMSSIGRFCQLSGRGHSHNTTIYRTNERFFELISKWNNEECDVLETKSDSGSASLTLKHGLRHNFPKNPLSLD